LIKDLKAYPVFYSLLYFNSKTLYVLSRGYSKLKLKILSRIQQSRIPSVESFSQLEADPGQQSKEIISNPLPKKPTRHNGQQLGAATNRNNW